MTERRAARRYDLSLSAIVSAPSGVYGIEQRGKTRDVSTRGVYLVLERPVSRDSEVDLRMFLSTDPSGGAVLVRAVGKIVRLEELFQNRTRRFGVAAVLRRYEIVRSEPVAPPTRTL